MGTPRASPLICDLGYHKVFNHFNSTVIYVASQAVLSLCASQLLSLSVFELTVNVILFKDFRATLYMHSWTLNFDLINLLQ